MNLTLPGSASVAVVCLSLILVWAAVAKIRNADDTAQEFESLGMPMPDLAAKLVPATEVIAAITLLVLPGWGSVFAFFLLAAFTMILLTILRSGVPLACGCFGSASRTSVGKADVIRNVVLLAFAVVGSLIDRLERPTLLDLVLIVFVAIVAVTSSLTLQNR